VIENPTFINFLISKKIVTEEDANALYNKFENDAFAILYSLIKNRVAPRDSLGKLWADSLAVSFLDLKKTLFQRDIVKGLPEKTAREHKIIPVYQMGGTVTVAMADPTRQDIIDEVKDILQCFISPVFSFPEDIDSAIDIEYQTKEAIDNLVEELSIKKFESVKNNASLEEMKILANEKVVLEFARSMFFLALRERASDIHIEPAEEFFIIRFRIDGILQEKFRLGISFFHPYVLHLKILATLDIVERRRPQDGRINFKLSDRTVDIRFSTVPTIYGEKVVMRLLDPLKADLEPDLSSMDFSNDSLKKIKKIINTPHGSFLITGPTGSGKTTTLYAILKELNKPGVNIMTVEDPVEYRLPGINQVQVQPAINLDFATVLRSFLRQDPDIILVGEIRDIETAKIASQAALTGHLVLATLHTNSALQAIIRLNEIGVPSYLVAPSILGAMGQRLVRKICQNCIEKQEVSPEEIEKYFIWDGTTKIYFSKGKGCHLCNFTGYFGRIAIHEVCLVNDEIRSLISQNAQIMEIEKCAMKYGFRNMRYDGFKKILRGLTTLEEINRVTLMDD